MWSSNYAVTPREMKAALERIAPMFRGWEQHDTHEFLRVVVDGLHVALNRAPKGPYPTLPTYTSARQASEAAARAHASRNKSIVSGTAAFPCASHICLSVWVTVHVSCVQNDGSRGSGGRDADVFCGQLCSAVRCSACGHVSYNFDACYDISVPLPSVRHGL